MKAIFFPDKLSVYILLVIFCKMSLVHAQTKNEKNNEKYNKILSEISSKTNPDTIKKEAIKIDGLKYRKHFFSVSGITHITFVKPIQMVFGVEASGGYRIFSKPKLNPGSSVLNPKIIEREIFIKPTFGYIYRKRYNTSFYFIPEIAYRHTFAIGIYTEINVDVGYQYSKLNAPVYERQSDGTFSKVRYGFHNVLVGGKILAGYDCSKKLEVPLAVHFGTGLLYRYPNNHQWVSNLLAEVGISYVFRREKE
ncbi:MAG: hypothetical protein U0U67_16630 [Chitinophagales bacterium]